MVKDEQPKEKVCSKKRRRAKGRMSFRIGVKCCEKEEEEAEKIDYLCRMGRKKEE